MAKLSRGGSHNGTGGTWAAAAASTYQTPTPGFTTPQPATAPPSLDDVANGNVTPTGGVPFAQFEKMTDDEKAQVITAALQTDLPFFLDDSGMQKLAYYTGMSDKPKVVTESQLAKIKGKDLWRSVKTDYRSDIDINYTGKEIYQQLVSGDFTMYSGTAGRSVHGRAIYFDDTRGSYGSGGAYTVIHSKLAPGARTITESSISNMFRQERQKGTALYRAISRADPTSQVTMYALAKGYDVVIDKGGTNYHMVLNRRALIVSDTTF